MPQNYSAWPGLQVAQAEQFDPNMLLLEQQAVQQNGVPQGIDIGQSHPPVQQKTAEDQSMKALLAQADQAQQESLNQQQLGVDQMQRFADQYQKIPQQMDLSGLASLADAWGVDKSNFAGNYRKPPTEQERAASIFELQNKLQQQKEGMTKAKYENMKAKIEQMKAMKVDPLDVEKKKATIRALNAAAGVKENPPEKDIPEHLSQSAGYANIMEKAEANLNKLLKSGFDPSAINNAAQTSAPNFAQTDAVKEYELQKRAFINAKLRKESGATIQPSEFKSAELQYFGSANDPKNVQKQKAELRRIAIEDMKKSAGRALTKKSSQNDSDQARQKERDEILNKMNLILQSGE